MPSAAPARTRLRHTCSVPSTTPTSSAAAGTATSVRPTNCDAAKRSMSSAAITAALRDGWTVVDEDSKRAATVPPRRHLRPAPHPPLAPCARSRAAVGRDAVSSRERIGRLRHGRGSRPADGDPRRGRPHRRAGARDGAALTAVRMQRRRAVRLEAPRRHLESAPTAARRRSPTIRWPTAIAHLRSIHERIPYVGAADLLSAVVDERRILDAALGGPDARDVWRRLRFVDRSGPGVGRCRRPWHPAIPRLGASAGVGGAGGRDDPSRTRPRCRSHHDRARVQGPRVPDHDRQRNDHAAEPPPRCAGGVGRRHLASHEYRRRRQFRRRRTDRRADERCGTPPVAVRRMHAGSRSPGRVAPSPHARRPRSQGWRRRVHVCGVAVPRGSGRVDIGRRPSPTSNLRHRSRLLAHHRALEASSTTSRSGAPSSTPR